MDKIMKPILCLDFDGVCHSYTSGWQGATVVPDPPVPGLIQFLTEAARHFDVQIYSSRSHYPGGIDAMRQWIADNGGWGLSVKFPESKPSATVTLDDRAITFTGTWPSIAELLAFKPWYKRGLVTLIDIDYTPILKAVERLYAVAYCNEATAAEYDSAVHNVLDAWGKMLG